MQHGDPSSKYLNERKIGQGAFGEVYVAIELETNRRVRLLSFFIYLLLFLDYLFIIYYLFLDNYLLFIFIFLSKYVIK